MGRLNHHSKERIVKLKAEGYKPSQILQILESEGVEIYCSNGRFKFYRLQQLIKAKFWLEVFVLEN
jgi:hypothetical protein